MIQTRPSLQTVLGKIAAGAGLSLVGALFSNAAAYAFGLLIAWSLGSAALGLYAIGLGLMQLANVICRLGLPEALLRFVPIYEVNDDAARLRGLLRLTLSLAGSVGLLGGALLFVCAGTIAQAVFRQPELTPYLEWFALALPIFTLFVVLANVFQALKRVDLVVLCRDLVQPLAMLLLAAVVLRLHTADATILGAYTGSIVIALVVEVVLLRRVASGLRREASLLVDWRPALAFALPIAGGDLAHYLFRYSDTLLLSLLTSPESVGIYSAALRTTLLLNLLATSLTVLFAPVVAQYHHEGRHTELAVIVQTAIRWSLTLALPLVALLGLLARDVLALWGDDFTAASTVLVLLAFGQLAFVLSNSLAQTLLMSGRQFAEMANVVLLVLLNVGLMLWLVPALGIDGAAIAVLLTQVVALILRVVELRLLIGVSAFEISHAKPVLAIAPVALVIVAARALFGPSPHWAGAWHLGGVIAVAITSLALYVVLLYRFGLQQDDIRLWHWVRRQPRSLLSS